MKIRNTSCDREFCSLIKPLLNTEMVQKLDNYTQHHFQSRLEHSIAVSYYSYKLGKKLGLNWRAMARGGLLHDLFFHDWRTTKFEEGSHAYVHPRIALSNAKKITSISSLEEDIIVNHMMGSTLDIPKSREAFCVSMIDKYLAVSEVSRGVFFSLFKNKEPYKHLETISSII